MKGFERSTRTYQSMAAKPPRSAQLFERARQERVAALESSERASLTAGWRERRSVLNRVVRGRRLRSSSFSAGRSSMRSPSTTAIFPLDTSYFRWYLENGALISIVFGFVSLAVRLDDYPDLISSARCATVLLDAQPPPEPRLESDRRRRPGAFARAAVRQVFDLVVSLFAWLAVAIGFVGWLLVVAPIQHLVYVVLGAPARNALRNQAAALASTRRTMRPVCSQATARVDT